MQVVIETCHLIGNQNGNRGTQSILFGHGKVKAIPLPSSPRYVVAVVWHGIVLAVRGRSDRLSPHARVAAFRRGGKGRLP